MRPNTFEIVYFDIGGTLVELPERPLSRRLGEVVGKEFFEIREAALQSFYLQPEVSDEALSLFSSVLELDKKQEQAVATLVGQSEIPKVFDDVELVLGRLRGVRLGLISNCTPAQKHAFKQSCIASFFEVELYSCDIGFAKPDQRMFELAEHFAESKAERICFVTDSRSEAEAAHKRGWVAFCIQRDLWAKDVPNLPQSEFRVIASLTALLEAYAPAMPHAMSSLTKKKY